MGEKKEKKKKKKKKKKRMREEEEEACMDYGRRNGVFDLLLSGENGEEENEDRDRGFAGRDLGAKKEGKKKAKIKIKKKKQEKR